jgi:hypothetical protein
MNWPITSLIIKAAPIPTAVKPTIRAANTRRLKRLNLGAKNLFPPPRLFYHFYSYIDLRCFELLAML